MPPPLIAAARLGISCRPMEASDLEFVEAVYASTRADELAVTGWSEAQTHAFLAGQHRAQHYHYQTYYEGADWLIVELEGRGIGRLYLAEWSQEVRVVDISLLPAARGQGIGATILRDVIDWAHGLGKDVSVHVEKHNPARHLYQRLNFVTVEDKGVYDLMKCAAPDLAGA